MAVDDSEPISGLPGRPSRNDRPEREPSPRDLRAIDREWPLIEAGLAVVEELARLAAEPVHRWLCRRRPGPAGGHGGSAGGCAWWATATECEVCEDFAGPYCCEERALQAAGGHDDRYHGGRPTAVAVPSVALLDLGGAA